MKDVIGFGALNVDTFYEINVDVSLVSKKLEVGEERSFKREELSPLLEKLRKIGKFKGSAGGGSATNVVYALSKLGFKTGYITKAGNDEFSNFSIHNLGAVDTSGIVKGKRR
ncbi:MAG: PfkB family carbohydrate kinase [Candidatus Aenigmarchaeota archaeon]|nr:PfkB family carbohydrate kinase [Candidatus Aenigmarchaeota archaeon]